MAITVQMIENKEFTTAPMGYKRKEVDMFLDEICDEMDRLNDEIQSLQLKLSQANQQGGQAYRNPQRAAGRGPLLQHKTDAAFDAHAAARPDPEPRGNIIRHVEVDPAYIVSKRIRILLDHGNRLFAVHPVYPYSLAHANAEFSEFYRHIGKLSRFSERLRYLRKSLRADPAYPK